MLNAADYLILTVVVFSALFGLWRGFAKEVFSLLTWFFACALSYLFYKSLAEKLPFWQTGEEENSLSYIIAVLVIFLSTLLVGSLLSKMFVGIVKMVGMSGKDRVLGFLFGTVRGGIITMVLLVFLPQMMSFFFGSLTPLSERVWWQESFFIPKFLTFEEQAGQIFDSISQSSSELFERFR